MPQNIEIQIGIDSDQPEDDARVLAKLLASSDLKIRSYISEESLVSLRGIATSVITLILAGFAVPYLARILISWVNTSNRKIQLSVKTPSGNYVIGKDEEDTQKFMDFLRSGFDATDQPEDQIRAPHSWDDKN